MAGIRGVATEIKVRFPFDKPDDAEIAQEALWALSWNCEVPASKVSVKVEDGWVCLSGSVEWHFQRSAAEADVRKLRGVINNITLEPRVDASDLREKLEAAFARNAEIEERNITVQAKWSGPLPDRRRHRRIASQPDALIGNSKPCAQIIYGFNLVRI